MKQPWLAVVLNFFPLIMGLGYIYIGMWGRFAVIFGLQLTSLLLFSAIGLRALNQVFLVLMWAFSWFDVYNQAKSYNSQKTQNH